MGGSGENHFFPLSHLGECRLFGAVSKTLIFSKRDDEHWLVFLFPFPCGDEKEIPCMPVVLGTELAISDKQEVIRDCFSREAGSQ